MKDCFKSLDILNERLKDHQFLATDAVTIADIQIFFEITSFVGANRYNLGDSYPKV